MMFPLAAFAAFAVASLCFGFVNYALMRPPVVNPRTARWFGLASGFSTLLAIPCLLWGMFAWAFSLWGA